MRDIISKLEELNTDQQPVQEVLSSKGKDNLIRAVQNFESMAEDLNLSDQAMDVIAMHLDDMLADVMEIEGVRESKQPVKEGNMSDMAQEVEKDHEVQMARNDLYKSAKYAVAIHKMMKDISEMEGIDGWVAAKITKAADYLGSVKHYMEGQMMADVELAVVPVAGDMTDAMTVPEEDAVEEVHEEVKEDAIGDIIKNLPKNKATKSTTSSDTGIMNQILDKLDMNKGIDGPAKTQTKPSTMPSADPKQPAKPPVPMQRKQAIANKMARDPYGADTTKSFGRLNDWSKK